MASLLAIRTELRTKVGNPSVAEVSDTVLDAVINQANKEIYDKYPFHAARRIVTFPTVASTGLYVLPTDCLSVYSLWNTTSGYQGKLLKRDENWLSTQQLQQNGPPTYYVRQRGWVQLSPTPDAVYSIRLMYKAMCPTLAEDTDEPVIPASWHDGIWRLARFIYWDEKGDLAKAQWSNNMWLQWVSDKPNEMQDEDFMDNTEGVVMPFLIQSPNADSFNSQNNWDRE